MSDEIRVERQAIARLAFQLLCIGIALGGVAGILGVLIGASLR